MDAWSAETQLYICEEYGACALYGGHTADAVGYYQMNGII